MKDSARSQELVEIARLYYEEHQTQAEISAGLGVSRSTVSRWLAKARRTGAVRIQVVNSYGDLTDMARALESRFGLRKVHVVPAGADPPNLVKRSIGIVAADFISRFVRKGDIIGVAWGSTLHEAVQALSPSRSLNVKVVQLVGAVGDMVQSTHANEIARVMAEAFGGEWYLLPAPGIVASKAAMEAFLREPAISRVIEMGKRADVAVLGVGACHSSSIVVGSGYVSPDQIEALRARGAAGDICCRFFDSQGEPVDHDLKDRAVAVELHDLRSIPLKIVLAGGRDKARAIAGALRGGYVDVLITDEQAAREVLSMSEPQPHSQLHAGS